MLRGTPGRYSSAKPCRRFWTNLERHLPTVGLEHLNDTATTSFVFPSAQANTIFDLKARACGLFGRRAQRERVSLSSSDSTRGAFGRPRSAMRTSIVAHGEEARRVGRSGGQDRPSIREKCLPVRENGGCETNPCPLRKALFRCAHLRTARTGFW